MATLRAKQLEKAAEAKKLKKVVKPVLSSPFTLQWPDLSDNAKVQLEAALTKVLMPLVEARNAVYKARDVSNRNNQDDIAMNEEPQAPVASTSTLPTQEPKQPGAGQRHPHPKWSTRQMRQAKRMTRLERTPGAQLPAGSHDVHLRSGKIITVPNHAIPEKFFPSMVLNKAAALDARPAISDHLVVGVNAVTRALEEEIEDAKRGVVGKPAPIREKEREQDSLRFFIPAPSFSTRKQRGEVRRCLHPEENHAKSKKRKRTEEKIEENRAAMPKTMQNIPKGDVVLLLTLEELLADLANGPAEGGLEARDVIASVIKHIKGDAEEPTRAHMATDTEPVSESSTISIPTKLISRLVGEASVIDAQARSILTSLLMRHDANWFAHHNKLASLQALQREAEDAMATASASGKRRKGTHRVDAYPSNTIDVSNTKTKLTKEGTDQTVTVLGPRKPLSLVFVAKDDINPVEIVTHVLIAVTSRNSINTALQRRTIRRLNKGKARDKDKRDEERGLYSFLQEEHLRIPDILLVPLPKGAEARLAEIIGIRRVSVLAFTSNQIAEFDQLRRLVQTHLPEGPHADWLVPATNYIPPAEDSDADVPGRHLPTSIKHLQTHAPIDLKAAKAAKKEAKQAKKKDSAVGGQGNGEGEEPLIATQL